MAATCTTLAAWQRQCCAIRVLAAVGSGTWRCQSSRAGVHPNAFAARTYASATSNVCRRPRTELAQQRSRRSGYPHFCRANAELRSKKKRPASLRAACSLTPRPGFEPGTCGLTVYRRATSDHALSLNSAPQFIQICGPQAQYGRGGYQICGATRMTGSTPSRRTALESEPSNWPLALL